MTKVITYGTFDLLHNGHIRLLKRAKALGDFLVVGVTSDDFDKTRGKINVQQSLSERINAVRKTGLADQIIVEEYEGQKIDDVRRFQIDIFAIGSDWKGKFDYLQEYCKVIYLERTQGISSSELRSETRMVSFGIVGDSRYLNKVANESKFVNGLKLNGICTHDVSSLSKEVQSLPVVTNNYEELLASVDAVYVHSSPRLHYKQTKAAILAGKHVLCESPVSLNEIECKELFQLAKMHHVVLLESLRTAYSTAYQRLRLMLKSGKIGKIRSIDATCTSLRSVGNNVSLDNEWSSLTAWGPTAMLPIFQILGNNFLSLQTQAAFDNTNSNYDVFVRMNFSFSHAVATLTVGNQVKSEGELIISGTQGYVYVPAPWWKTDYFEIRYENQNNNRRYYYPLEGEGIRYELVSFLKTIASPQAVSAIDYSTTQTISSVMQSFYEENDYFKLD